METLSRIIGLRLRQARERLGLTQEELGRRLSVLSREARFSTSMVSLLEAGKRPIKVEDLPLFARALDVAPAFFLGETVLAAPSASQVRHVFLRATRFLHPGARIHLEEFIEQVESGPPSPSPVLRVSPATRPMDLVRSAGYAEPQVDPSDVAYKVGLRVVYLDLDEDVSGALVVAGDHRVIGVNRHQAPVRQRFSIAHELAHYVRGHSTTVDIDVTNKDWFAESGADPIEERQANSFAAELLMPGEWVERDFRSLGGDHEVLASQYGVSKQAMWIRLMELGLVSEALPF